MYPRLPVSFALYYYGVSYRDHHGNSLPYGSASYVYVDTVYVWRTVLYRDHYRMLNPRPRRYNAEPFADPRLTPELQARVLGALLSLVAEVENQLKSMSNQSFERGSKLYASDEYARASLARLARDFP
jgi:hypothetical protein